MTVITSGTLANAVKRDLIELATWSIVPDANGLFTLADDTPLRLVGMVSNVCDRNGLYDFKMASDGK